MRNIEEQRTAMRERRLHPERRPHVDAGPWQIENGCVVGWATNTSPRTWRLVRVKFHLLDKDGARIGDASAAVSDLEAGAVWKYRAPFYGDQVKTVEPFSIDYE